MSGDVRPHLAAARAALAEGHASAALSHLRAALTDDTDFVTLAKIAKRAREIPVDAVTSRRMRLAILAASTVDHLADGLRLWLLLHGIDADIHIAPHDTMAASILDADSELYRFRPHWVWLFTTFRDVDVAVSPGIAPDTAVTAALDHMSVLCRTLVDRAGCQVLVNNADLPAEDPFGHLAGAAPWGRLTALRLYNALLPGVLPHGAMVFDLDQGAAFYGRGRWVDPRYWLHSKHAFAPDATGPMAAMAARLLAAASGLSRKALVLDLDNTLWGGVVGDDGVAGLTLGQGAAGEAFVAFQHFILGLQRRGIVLAVCSKNDEANAKAPFRDHPDMVLRLDDIAVFRANWANKADNIRDIAASLDLGLDALVFIDDNPMERDLVRTHLPQVAVPDLPDDPALYVQTLARSGLFEMATYAAEDGERARYYADNAKRAESRAGATDMATYLAGLDMRAQVGRLDALSLPRAAQLINKSNQFHLTGLRVSEAELAALDADPAHTIYQYRLADRFGDNGLIAVTILRRDGEAMIIDAWVMSCRVLGRRMEEFIAADMAATARAAGCTRLVGFYRPSPRNGLVAGLYPRLGFRHDGGDAWSIDPARTQWSTPIQQDDKE